MNMINDSQVHLQQEIYQKFKNLPVCLLNNFITMISDYLAVIYLPTDLCTRMKYSDFLNHFLLVLKILPVGTYFIFIDRKGNINFSGCT